MKMDSNIHRRRQRHITKMLLILLTLFQTPTVKCQTTSNSIINNDFFRRLPSNVQNASANLLDQRLSFGSGLFLRPLNLGSPVDDMSAVTTTLKNATSVLNSLLNNGNLSNENISQLNNQMNSILTLVNSLNDNMSRRNVFNTNGLTGLSGLSGLSGDIGLNAAVVSRPVISQGGQSAFYDDPIITSYTSYTDLNGEEVYAYGILSPAQLLQQQNDELLRQQEEQQRYNAYFTTPPPAFGGGQVAGGAGGFGGAAGGGGGKDEKCSVYVILAPIIIITVFMGIIVLHLGDPRIWPSIVRTFSGVIVSLLSVFPANGGFLSVNTDANGNLQSLSLAGLPIFDINRINTDNLQRSMDTGYFPWEALYGLEDIIMSAVYDEDCMERLTCETGRYVDDSYGLASTIAQLLPDSIEKYTDIFVKSSNRENDCRKSFKCSPIDSRRNNFNTEAEFTPEEKDMFLNSTIIEDNVII